MGVSEQGDEVSIEGGQSDFISSKGGVSVLADLPWLTSERTNVNWARILGSAIEWLTTYRSTSLELRLGWHGLMTTENF